MRTILLIKKGGKYICVIAEKTIINSSISGIEEKSTGDSISKGKLAYKLTRLEKGIEKEKIGYIPTILEGEVDFYKLIGRKSFTHVYGKGFENVVLWAKKEKINIKERVYDIY